MDSRSAIPEHLRPAYGVSEAGIGVGWRQKKADPERFKDNSLNYEGVMALVQYRSKNSRKNAIWEISPQDRSIAVAKGTRLLQDGQYCPCSMSH